ncbi:MAG: 3-dehydro-L-gulonate 2-dehydrogenase [Clostridia bacterium]|nr:3-dehydro-L-gulonate 2-dehydrogenase [Clostridia bacterium]
MVYIKYDELVKTLEKGLIKAGLDAERAAKMADVFAGNSLEGVYSHGVNRYMRFITEAENGVIDLNAQTEVVSSFGGIEVRDAHYGIGPLNAEAAMARAVELSKEHGIACVALRNTNHWLRPGRYGWQAANAGVIGMCWSNTINNMPAWGAVDPRLGNNPIVLAIPRKKGNVVVDMAMTQFAFGKLELAKLSGEQLPMYGGYDSDGNLTTDPAEIQKTRRALPIGYWKGSGMSLALDMIASATALGRTTAMISADSATEHGLTQIFIAINFRAAVDADKADEILDTSVDYMLGSIPVDPESPVRYPGQNVEKIRKKNLENGVPIHEETWEKIVKYIG